MSWLFCIAKPDRGGVQILDLADAVARRFGSDVPGQMIEEIFCLHHCHAHSKGIPIAVRETRQLSVRYDSIVEHEYGV